MANPVRVRLTRALDRLPEPSVATQRRVTGLAVLTQAGIAVTGAVVRVTGSGLGCPEWPQCFPGSMVPIGGQEVPPLEQALEFGNRLLTYVVVLAAAAAVLVVLRARRRPAVRRMAWVLPLGTVVQAVLGGVTVLTGLQWWTVAPHFLVSMVLVWVAVQLHVAVAQPDDGVSRTLVPGAVRSLLVLTTAVLAALTVAGTLVTAAGPHSGSADVDRLDVLGIETLVHLHSDLLVAFLGLLAGLVFALRACAAPAVLRRRVWVLVAVVLAQGLVGVVQYRLAVPEALVALHVAGAAAVVVATAAVWAHTRQRVAATSSATPSTNTLSAAPR